MTRGAIRVRGQVISKLRAERVLSQEDLASRTRLSVRTIIRAQQGGPLFPDSIYRLASALGVEVDALIARSRAGSRTRTAVPVTASTPTPVSTDYSLASAASEEARPDPVVEVRINRNLADATDDEISDILWAIAALLRRHPTIQITSIRPTASYLLSLQLSQEEAERLVQEIESGALSEFGVVGAEIREDDEDSTFEVSDPFNASITPASPTNYSPTGGEVYDPAFDWVHTDWYFSHLPSPSDHADGIESNWLKYVDDSSAATAGTIQIDPSYIFPLGLRPAIGHRYHPDMSAFPSDIVMGNAYGGATIPGGRVIDSEGRILYAEADDSFTEAEIAQAIEEAASSLKDPVTFTWDFASEGLSGSSPKVPDLRENRSDYQGEQGAKPQKATTPRRRPRPIPLVLEPLEQREIPMGAAGWRNSYFISVSEHCGPRIEIDFRPASMIDQLTAPFWWNTRSGDLTEWER